MSHTCWVHYTCNKITFNANKHRVLQSGVKKKKMVKAGWRDKACRCSAVSRRSSAACLQRRMSPGPGRDEESTPGALGLKAEEESVRW